MSQLLDKAFSVRKVFRRKVTITVGLLVVVLLIVISLCAVLAMRVAAGQTARKELKVMPLGSFVTSDWRLSSRGALATDGRTTQIRVQLARASDAVQTPHLTGNFDGSGGGDAKLVNCSARPAKWTVPNGSSQTIPLTCNAIVAPAVVRQIQYVYVGAQA